MTSPSVSFRISRNTEDLAETIHALSQRLVRLEQRLAAVDLLIARRDESDPSELESLDNVERLLRDCRDLLEADAGAESTPDQPLLSAEGPQVAGDFADDDDEDRQLDERYARAA
jgi:hypothetical protein